MATPLLCALMWLGALPSFEVIILGLVTVFAGYTAVYALNDIIDYPVDREEVQQERGGPAGSYLDAVLVHHPMAQGLLSFRSGVVWSVGWGCIAMVGAWLLNPVCLLIFVFGCALEAVYCLLLRVSYLRVLISGVVKTCGGMAAVFAVDPQPFTSYLVGLFCWLFIWEVGGQNIPADLTDIQTDKESRAQTVPSRFGSARASWMALIALTGATILGSLLLRSSALRLSWYMVALSFVSGLVLLLVSAVKLCRLPDRKHAMSLFNQASYYPLSLLVIVIVGMVGK